MEVSASLKKVETYFEGFYTSSVSPRFVSRINLLYNRQQPLHRQCPDLIKYQSCISDNQYLRTLATNNVYFFYKGLVAMVGGKI